MTGEPGAGRAGARADLLLLSLGHCATDLSQGALPVILPLLQTAFGLTYALIGGIVTVFNLAASLAQPALGLVSDGPAGGWLLPAGVGLSGLGLAGLALAPTYGWVLGAAVVTGLGVAAWHPAGSRAAYRVTAERRGSGTAIFSVGGNAGFALGPLAMGGLIALGGRRLGSLAGLPALLVAVFFLTLIPALSRRLKADEARAGAQPAGVNRWGAQVAVTLVSVTRASLHYGVVTLLPFYLLRVLHAGPASVGLSLFVYLGAGAAGTLVGGTTADRIGPRAVLIVSMALALPLAALTVRSGWPGMLPWLAGLGFTLIASNVVTLVLCQDYLPRLPGVAAGINTGAFIGFGGLAVLAMGAAVDRWGLVPTLRALTVLPALAGVLALLLPRTHWEGGRASG